MAFTNAATIVVAQVFELLDPNGVIVASLGSGTGGGFPFGGAFSQLAMFHNDPNTTDSSLAWTQSGATGTEIVRLEGPSSAGGGLQGRPQLSLYRQNPGIPFTGVVLNSGRPDGALQPTSYIQMDQGDAGAGSMIFTSDTQGTVQANTGARGLMYGESQFHIAAAATVALTLAVQVVCTQVLPNVPIAGAFMDASWEVYLNQTVVGTAGAFFYLLMDGVQIPVTSSPVQVWDDAIQLKSSGARAVAIPVGVGNHTIQLVCSKGAAGGAAAWQISNTALDIILHR